MKDYYHIDNQILAGDETIFEVSLLPDYCAYAGHFPDNPVSPGVCNIQMIKACVERVTGKRLFLGYIAQCRFSAVMTPQTTPHLRLRMRVDAVDGMYKVSASLFDEIKTYIDFKGEFSIVKA